jgi:hypothetical protein
LLRENQVSIAGRGTDMEGPPERLQLEKMTQGKEEIPLDSAEK